jgi:hypothetical protein
MVESNHSMRRKKRDQSRLVFSELLRENQKIFRFRAVETEKGLRYAGKLEQFPSSFLSSFLISMTRSFPWGASQDRASS